MRTINVVVIRLAMPNPEGTMSNHSSNGDVFGPQLAISTLAASPIAAEFSVR
jgi:hypothetical protein